jgi:hypothetical protein
MQVANNAGFSISHIGHSRLAGSSLQWNVHVPHIHNHLLSVYRLVSDNDVFVEFHRLFFLVKDKSTNKILLHCISHRGLYSIPFSRALPPHSRQASSGMKITSSLWHHDLGHPTNNVVQTIVRQNDLVCSSNH